MLNQALDTNRQNPNREQPATPNPLERPVKVSPKAKTNGAGEEADPSQKIIADRLKRWREEAGLTLKDLANRSGVSASTVHKVENGQVSPTLSVLLKIAAGLDRHPGDLVSLDEDKSPDYCFTSSDDRHMVGRQGGNTVQKTVTDLDSPMIDLWRATIQPGVERPYRVCHDNGEVIILVEEGELTVYLDNENRQMKKGDSLHAKAWVPYRWQNTGDVPVVLTVAVTIPQDTAQRSNTRSNAMWKRTVDRGFAARRSDQANGITPPATS